MKSIHFSGHSRIVLSRVLLLQSAVAVACKQAFFLGLTRLGLAQDLFWARAASGRERIGAGTILSRLSLLAAGAQNKSHTRPK